MIYPPSCRLERGVLGLAEDLAMSERQGTVRLCHVAGSSGCGSTFGSPILITEPLSSPSEMQDIC